MQFTPILDRCSVPEYVSQSWIDPRAQAGQSPIQGTGLFAAAPFRRGEIVVIWGGTLFSDDEVSSGIARPRSCVLIDEALHLGSFRDEPETLDEFMNHSCDPNIWLHDEVTLVACRDVATGEELTIDYGLWETDALWTMPCVCRSAHCRHVVTGDDWKRKELQERYGSHFSPYVNRRITLLARKARGVRPRGRLRYAHQ